MIMEQGKDAGIYRLVVVVADPSGGFDLVADNGKLLSNGRDTEEYHYVLDAARFRIHHGTFSVETVRCCLGGSASTTMTFQLRNDRFAMIGFDYLGDHRGQLKLSFNMLSGRVLATQSDDDPASDFYGRRERKEGSFSLPSPIYLDAMTSPDEFDASKYSPLN